MGDGKIQFTIEKYKEKIDLKLFQFLQKLTKIFLFFL